MTSSQRLFVSVHDRLVVTHFQLWHIFRAYQGERTYPLASLLWSYNQLRRHEFHTQRVPGLADWKVWTDPQHWIAFQGCNLQEWGSYRSIFASDHVQYDWFSGLLSQVSLIKMQLSFHLDVHKKDRRSTMVSTMVLRSIHRSLRRMIISNAEGLWIHSEYHNFCLILILSKHCTIRD